MTTNRKWLYAGAVLAALLQTGILYAGIGDAAILRSGQDIVFQTEPVDPRDLMRGDYVVLGYEISNIARSAIQGVRPAGSRTVYVAVKPDAKGISRFSRASFVPFRTSLPAKPRFAAKRAMRSVMIRRRIFASVLALSDIMCRKVKATPLRVASASTILRCL